MTQDFSLLTYAVYFHVVYFTHTRFTLIPRLPHSVVITCCVPDTVLDLGDATASGHALVAVTFQWGRRTMEGKQDLL